MASLREDGRTFLLVSHNLADFRLLEQHGLLRNAIVVLTADHGEALGEDGFLTHALGGFLEMPFEVPLVIRGYGISLSPTGPLSALTRAARVADSLRIWARTDDGREPPVNTFRRHFNLDPLARVNSPSTLPRRRAVLASGSPATATPVAQDSKTKNGSSKTKEERERDEEAIRRLRSLGYLK